MSIIGSNVLAGASGSGVEAYEIEQSLRFNSGDSTKLSRTFSSDNSNANFTVSFWCKRGELAAYNSFIAAQTDASNYEHWMWYNNDSIGSSNGVSGTANNNQSTAVFRDPSAWYHVVWKNVASGATTVHVNGTQVLSFTRQHKAVNKNVNHNIGVGADNGSFRANFYLAEYHLVDGSALDPTEFAEYDDNGVWRPIEYTGSYGTNGFYLKFDETATNGIGHDHSGNGNNFTASGFVTSGTGTDVMSDTPTTNWCTLNPLAKNTNLSDGNLVYNTATAESAYSTFGVSSGKWYYEITCGNANTWFGVGTDPYLRLNASASNQVLVGTGGGTVYSQNSTNTFDAGETWTTGDIIGVEFNADDEECTFYKNGTRILEWDTFTSDGPYFFGFDRENTTPTTTHTVNFGQREFAYPPGTASATDYFNCVTYTANNQSSLSVTGVGFQPDMVWLKTRGRDEHHYIYDAVRGAGDRISPSQTIKETTGDNTFTSFDSDGFTLGADGAGIANYQTDSMVAWCWKAGGSGSANNTGSINATVSASQDAGFSIVTFSGGGSAGTVAHGLSSAPKVYFVKNLSSDTAYNWYVYTETTGTGHFLKLNASTGKTASNDPFNNTAPTSSVFSVGGENVVSGVDYVAYCWEEKTGVSKFGSYTGNGSSTGPFIECGFKPRMVIVKRTDAASNWFMYDTIRGTNNKLYADSNQDENGEDGGSTSSNTILSLSTGFQMTSGNGSNTNGGTYTFMAWAETFSADADFKSLNTANLPAPEIKDGSEYFSTTLYTGVSGSQDVATGMATDLAWIKSRSTGQSHSWTDRVRGNDLVLQSNENSAETSGDIDLTSTGVTIGDNNALRGASGVTYVLWSWLAGGSVSADNNTNGSITSTVSVNATAGFSIVSYTGENAVRTVGHGLGVAPVMYMTKNLDSSNDWAMYWEVLGANRLIHFNLVSKNETDSGYWNDTAPTSTVFTVGTNTRTGGTTDDYIAYCFAEVEGYSKFSEYAGNGSTDGPFVYCGFRPAMVVIKNYGGGSETNWIIRDSARSPSNKVHPSLYPNTDEAEIDNFDMDFLSNGFKIKDDNAVFNENGSDYLFMAFAENPFGGDGVSPANAR